MRKAAVTRLAGVPESAVEQVSAATVRQALADRVSATVLEAALIEPAVYWRVGQDFFFDDPGFGEVVSFADLDYDVELGLHDAAGEPLQMSVQGRGLRVG